MAEKMNMVKNARDGRSVKAPLLLVVEDELDFQTVIVAELRDQFQVVTALNGREGLEKALEYVPDLIITDIMMPVMDGIELCRELKLNSTTSHVPIIMLTAKSSVESHVEGLETGADAYVTKPFHMALLEARIHNLLTSRQRLREQYSREFSLTGTVVSEREVEREFIDQAVLAVQARMADPLFRSEDLADALSMGLRSVQRKLKALTNLSTKQFINDVRVRHAAKLLIESPLSITEVSFEIGCEDASNFSKIFRHHFKQSPSEFRSAHRTR